MSRNEAAERLREWLHRVSGTMSVELRDALATERRLTVERIRERLDKSHGVGIRASLVILDILDDLATADVDEEATDAD